MKSAVSINNNSYPHKCKVCGRPSLNGNMVVLCSNTKCKTWKPLRKISSEIKPIRDLDADGFLLCICGQRARCTLWNGNNTREERILNIYTITCNKCNEKKTLVIRDGYRLWRGHEELIYVESSHGWRAEYK